MDSTSNLDLIDANVSAHEVTANALMSAASGAIAYAMRASTTAALTWGYYGGGVLATTIANGTVALTASNTNYVVVNRSTGAVSVSTSNTNWNDTTTYGRAYLITADAATVTSYEDWRYRTGGINLIASAAPSGAAGGDLTGTFPNPTVDANKITLAKMATVATATILGRTTAGTGNVEALTATQAKGVLAIATGDVSGLGTAATLASTALIHADGSVAFSADQSLGSHKLTNVTDPSSAQDAATMGWVQSLAVNLGKRARVRAATTANITIATALNNADTLDGVTLATGDLVLVKDQSAPAENGVYVVGVSPARDAQFDTYDEHPGSLIAVEEGSTNADTLWLCTSNVGGTINSTAIAFSALSVSGGINQITGDGAAGPGTGSQALTLATVNANVGSFGDATHVAQFTVSAKGLITAVANVAITPAAVASDPVSNSFRLSLSTGTPITSADVTGATTIYACTYKGNSIGLYDGAQWNIRTSAEFSLALGTLAAAYQAYDVFCYDNAGTPTLEALEWQNGTATMTAANPCVVTWTGAGITAEDPIVLTTSGAIPAPLSVNTRYYASNISGSTFNLTTSPGGTPINTTGGTQSGTHTAHCALRRQTALAYQDGILVKSGDATRRYLGSFYSTATTATEMSVGGTTTEVGGKFFIWNYYHRTPRHLYVQEFTDSWSQNTTSTWRVANGQVANAGAAPNAIEFFVGLVEDVADATLVVVVTAGSTGAGSSQLAIGFNTRLVPGGLVAGAYGTTLTITTRRSVFPRLGYNYFSWLERATQSGTTTWFGDNAGAGFQSGMLATIFG